MAWEFAFGFITKVAAAGMTRTLGLLYAPIRRRQAIDRKTTKSSAEDAKDKFSAALNDLRILLGNNYGEYTISVESLFGELQRSTFPELLTNSILVGADPEAAWSLFSALHEKFLKNGDLPASDLFRFIENSIRAQHDLLTSDREILEFIAQETTGLKDRLEGATSNIARMISDVADPQISTEVIANIREDVCKALEAKYHYVPTETTRGTRRHSIKKLFIEPRFSHLDYDSLSASNKEKQNEHEVEEPTLEITYAHLRSIFHRTVILGDPGGGKSTTIQNICYEFSKALSLAINFPDRESSDPIRQRIPLRVVLRAFENKRSTNHSLSVLEFIIDELAELVDQPRGNIEKFARYSLATGTAIVLFDGLDEVLDVGNRRNYVELVEQFATQFPATAILVTSRHVGYVDAPLSPDFQCLSLARFNENEIQTYARKLLSAVKGVKENTLDSDVQQFLTQTSRNARDLRENPLMLALMVWIFSIKGDVPANRPEIYKECATLMFERWDQNRGIIAKIPRDFELIDLFGFIAHEVFGRPSLEEGVSREWLLAKMKGYFVKWYEDKAKAHETASSIVDFLVGRAWVMSEVGPGLFKFTHRTFLEYFYAKYLNGQVDSVRDLVLRLRSRIYAQQLDVVNHLSLQMFTFREPRKIHEAAQELTNLIDESRENFGETMNAMNFFARSFEYLLTSEQQFRSCAKALCKRLIEIGATGKTQAVTTLSLLSSNSGTRFTLLIDIANEAFGREILSGDEKRFDFIISVLVGGRVRGRGAGNPVALRLHSPRYVDLMRELKVVCARRLENLAKSDGKIASLVALLNPEMLAPLYRRHGASLFGDFLKTDAFFGPPAISFLLRAIGGQGGLFPAEAPWITVSPDGVGDFFVNLLNTGFAEGASLGRRNISVEIDLLVRRALQRQAQRSQVYYRQFMDPKFIGIFFLGLACLCELENVDGRRGMANTSSKRAHEILLRRKKELLNAIPKITRHEYVDRARRWAEAFPSDAAA